MQFKMMSSQTPTIPSLYRLNVAIVVINSEGKILACERSNMPGAWQLPQGGVDLGENLDSAMLRELKEEIGTTDVDIIGKLDDTIRYEWPEIQYEKGYRGQEQHYFLVKLNPQAVINLDSHHTVEFSKVDWLSSEEFFTKISGFKKEAYQFAIRLLKTKYPNTID